MPTLPTLNISRATLKMTSQTGSATSRSATNTGGDVHPQPEDLAVTAGGGGGGEVGGGEVGGGEVGGGGRGGRGFHGGGVGSGFLGGDESKRAPMNRHVVSFKPEGRVQRPARATDGEGLLGRPDSTDSAKGAEGYESTSSSSSSDSEYSDASDTGNNLGLFDEEALDYGHEAAGVTFPEEDEVVVSHGCRATTCTLPGRHTRRRPLRCAAVPPRCRHAHAKHYADSGRGSARW